MITTRCPTCGNETRVPDSILGKKVRCKDPACGQIYPAVQYVESIVAAAPGAVSSGSPPVPEDLFQTSQPEPEWSSPDEVYPVNGSRRRGKSTQGGDTSAEFKKNLDLFRIAARVYLVAVLTLSTISLFLLLYEFLDSTLPIRMVIRPLVLLFLSYGVVIVASAVMYFFAMTAAAFFESLFFNKVNTKS